MKLAMLLFIPGLAWGQCVLQDRTVRQSQVTIEERSAIRTEVVPGFGAQRRCMVSFQARVGGEWHQAFGEYEWPGDRPREEACAVAMKLADDQVRDRVARSRVVSEQVLICTDNPDHQALKELNPGTVGRLSQFRPHPDRPRLFWHNGAQCRYFLDSKYTGSDIRTWEGIICQLQGDNWVVVDKF